MQQAPPVEYPLGDNSRLRRLVLSAWLLVAMTGLAWLAMADLRGWRVWLGLALMLLTGALAFRCRPSACTGTLNWDGGNWCRRDGAHASGGQATAHLDLQSALLVYWRPELGPGSWCWLDSTANPSRWLAVRRALYAHALVDAVPGTGVRAPDTSGQA
jgi:hypothetical protein